MYSRDKKYIMKSKFSKKCFCVLKDRIKQIMPARLSEFKEVKEKLGEKKMGEFTVRQAIG
jgi:hypothetical protein